MWKNEELKKFYLYEFDFDNQNKETYDDWLRAFENAVKKRAVDRCFLGLSSGYDSGALANELVKQGVDFKAYAVFNNENKEIIDKRLEKIKDFNSYYTVDEAIFTRHFDFLKGKINETALQDTASMGVSFMFESARAQKRTVCISGQGGDEIVSDYALFPKQSHFKGKYPEKLYEWPNFRGHMQMEYLNELEDIAGVYGIEMRYPFLDTDLVQEFLWLTPELKNAHYKAPIREYLIRNEVPFEEGVKKGFNPLPKNEAKKLMK